jgi:hypothetical protein
MADRRLEMADLMEIGDCRLGNAAAKSADRPSIPSLQSEINLKSEI